MTHHVVMYSGGKASWLAAHRVKERHGDTSPITLLFTDTKTEDADLYRFLEEGAVALDLPLVRLADGRDIWDVFKDSRFLGNNRVPVCSRILKQEISMRWVKERCDPGHTVLHFGIDWTEAHRADRIPKHWEPFAVDFPLLWEPMSNEREADDLLAELGVEEPRLYKLGAPHNNCGGLCVRAGHAHFKWALRAIPDTYAKWEAKEGEMREFLDADVAIMRDRSGGESKPLTMKDFRLKVESEDTGQLDLFEWGGCGCMTDDD
tara:strand:+ start:57 stop:842 length:786 start_codon:yes stop_codon:yes gene_type:complete